MQDDEYIPLRKAAKLIGLQGRSIRGYSEKGIFKTYISPSGQTLYNKQSLLNYIDNFSNVKEEGEQKSIIYIRFNSKEQEKNDVQRSIELGKQFYPCHEIISDIGFGIDFKRKGLQTILQLANEKRIKEFVIFHSDQISRIGYELIETIINISGAKIINLNNENYKSTEQELARELLSITSFYSIEQPRKTRKYNKNIKAEAISNGRPEASSIEVV